MIRGAAWWLAGAALALGTLVRRRPPAAIAGAALLEHPTTRRSLAGLHAAARRRAEELVRSCPVPLVITSGLRSYEEQEALYAQGRTAPGRVVTNARAGESWHNHGLAFDVAPLVDGRIAWPEDEQLWQRIGASGKALGLEWGGDWATFRDRPHFQLTGGLTLAQAHAGARPVVT